MSNENTFTIENTFDDLFLDENKQDKIKKSKEIDYQDIKEFVHLNVHSDHSILLGYGTVKEYVDTAKELNMSAIALTDFNSVTGIYDFLNECNKNNILGIPGIVLNVKAETTNYYNLTLLAYNKKGLYNIIKLSSIAYNHYEETPMITLEELFLYNEGIIVLTGNSNGLIGKLNNKKSINELKNIISRIQAVFNENFYIELINDENIKIKSLLKISSLYEIKTVITNDVYMPKQEDWKAQESIMAIGNNDFITETSILSGGKRQVIDNGEHRKYLKTLKEMNDVFPIKKYKVCYENTLAIVDKCRNGNPQLEYNEHLRPMKELNGISANDYLKKLVQDGFGKIRKKQDKTTQQESIKRIKEELEVIISNDFVHYFLVVQDYIKFAKDNDIPVGPGRGSAGGSEIAYLLGITEIDPIKYDLLFSRFLSSGRGNIYKIDFTDKTTEKIMLSEKINIIENGNIVNKYIYELKPNDKLEDGRIVEHMKIDKVGSSPDIDTDFHTELREKVIQYCIDTYGKEKVANIITFGMFKPKNAIKSIMKINNVPFSTSNAITKLISQDDKTIEDSINNNKDFMDFVKMSKLENIIIDSKKMENRIRNLGVHACGVIISNDEINNSVPTTIRQDDGALITAWDYPTCESLGLLKADFLGLDTLDVIKLSLEYIKETEPEKAMTFEDLYNLPTDDKETFKLFQEGKTTSVFQFGSIGMKDLLRQMKPTCFDDISATTALYRPGPKEQGFHTKYAKRKNGEDKDTTPIHKSFIGTEVEKILAPTQNLLVYQEQIMQISMRCAGFSSMEADSLRKAIGKKKADLMVSMKPRFVQGMLDNGYQKQAIEEMWKIFVSFGQYAFNKSHSIAYSIISYICAYLRTHFPVQYMAAMLQQKIKTDDFKEYLADVKNIPNVSLQSININESTNNIIPSKDLSKIILGLSSIKGINQTELEEIIKERETNGKFTNFENCLHRLHKINCLKKGLLELLAKSGAFDCFGVNRKSVADNAKEIIKCIEKDLEPKIMMTFDFGIKNNLFHEEVYKTTEDDYNYIEKCKIEFDLLGLYLTTNPLSKLEYQNQSLINKDFNFYDGKNDFIVVIPEFKKKITKNGISYNFKLVNEKNEINLNASKRAKFLLWLNDNKNNPEVRNFIKNNEISKELKNQLNKDSLWFSKKDILEELREIFIKKKESFCLPKLHTPYKIEISHNSYGTTILDWTEIYIDENGKRPLVFPVYSKEEIEKLKNIFKNPDITKNGKTPIIIRKINKMNIINDIPIKKFFVNFENINTLYSMLAKQKLQNCDFLEKL